MDAEIDQDGWITKNGRHIDINTKTGEVNAGMGGVLNGVKLSGGPKKTGEGSKSSSQGSSSAGGKSKAEMSSKGSSGTGTTSVREDMRRYEEKNAHRDFIEREKTEFRKRYLK